MVIDNQRVVEVVAKARKRDVRQAHYTSSPYILDYMVSQLRVSSEHSVLEPCAGEGHLVDAVLEIAPSAAIDAYEYDKSAARLLLGKYSSRHNVHVYNDDALEVAVELMRDQTRRYDRIIANPPYGAWQDYSRRRWLRMQFPTLYVRETYGLFLYCCISLLAPEGRLVFIVPDTFLNLHLHRELRHHILTETSVDEIVIFPSRFFKGVSYGYSKMSIITLVRRRVSDEDGHRMHVIRNLKSTKDLSLLAQGFRDQEQWELIELTQRQVLQNPSHAFLLPNGIETCRTPTNLTIGDVADVVTGFYSGDDRKWLSAASESVRGANRYRVIEREHIAPSTLLSPGNSLAGLRGEQRWIPIVKGGGRPFLKPTEWYVDWGTAAIREYTKPRPNKARFQNSRYYFRDGIGIPMVSSTRVTAALLENRLFDQSIVGVFPRDEKLLLYLLGFFNSDVCTRLLRTINPTANNSANYVKRLPFIRPVDEIRNLVTRLVETIAMEIRQDGRLSPEKFQRLNEIFESVYCS